MARFGVQVSLLQIAEYFSMPKRLECRRECSMQAPAFCSMSCVDVVLSHGTPLSDFGEPSSVLESSWVV